MLSVDKTIAVDPVAPVDTVATVDPVALEKSIMPDSLLREFTAQDVADLLEFLSQLK